MDLRTWCAGAGLVALSAAVALTSCVPAVDGDDTGGAGGDSMDATGGGGGGARGGSGGSGPVATAAPVVITEIMYHPVDEDDDQEFGEFVELYNRTGAAVAVGGWSLTSAKGLKFVFAAGTTLMPRQYAVVARNRKTLAMVWGMPAASLLGDYQGMLDNGGDTVMLIDPAGDIVDAVKYDDKLPWPTTADAFGLGDDFLPPDQLPISRHRYKGRSLERISIDGPSGYAANWEASPIDGSTPGKANAGAGTMLPVAEKVAAGPDGGTGLVIRSNQKVAITTRFSDVGPVSNVEVEYFVDDVTRTGIPTKVLAMTALPDGSYKAVLPDQLKDNDLVRYRIKATRGGKGGVVAPRATDAFTWFGAFISPRVFVTPGVETKERVYHLFIRPSDWTTLEQRTLGGRTTPAPSCTVNPDWDTLVPATFVHEGKVYDVRVRYSGSRYNRGTGNTIASWPYPGPMVPMGKTMRALSWRIKFPRFNQFEGLTKIALNKQRQGCPGTVSSVESRLLQSAGIPSYNVRYARLHINGGYYHYAMEPEDIDEALVQRAYPAEAVGDLFKTDGLFGVDGEGPWGNSDFTPLKVNSMCPTAFTLQQRYATTYDRKTFSHRTHDELVKVIDELAAARAQGPAAVVTYFNKYWDVDALATIYAIRNWAGVWDDTFHNWFPYRRPNGKWLTIPQDFEWDFGLGKAAKAVTSNPQEPSETLYIGWNSPDVTISKQCEMPPPPMGTTLRCNSNGFFSLKDAFIGAFKARFDDKMRELVRRGVLSAEGVLKVIDQEIPKFGLDDWLASPAAKACDVPARQQDMRTWAMGRHATVVARLKP